MSGPKILAIAASYRPDSFNKKLLALAAAEARKAGASVTVREFADYESPICRHEKMPLPDGAKKLADDVLAHDGLLLASPEYNWSIPGSLKNLIDWLSIDTRLPLDGKTTLLMCATPSVRGGVTGLQHLRTSLEMLHLWIYPQIIAIGRAHEQFGEAGLSREADQQHLTFCVEDFIRATAVLRARD